MKIGEIRTIGSADARAFAIEVKIYDVGSLQFVHSPDGIHIVREYGNGKDRKVGRVPVRHPEKYGKFTDDPHQWVMSFLWDARNAE